MKKVGVGLTMAISLVWLGHGQKVDAQGTVPAAATSLAPAQAKPVSDWAHVDRYREANLKLGAPAEGENRIVFMGDSITDGWLGKSPKFWDGRPYYDRGISGQTTTHMLERFESDVIRLRPAVVVILAGTNDVAGNLGFETDEIIEDNFRAMVTLAKANHIRVVLCSIPPASHFPWRAGPSPVARIRGLNDWLRTYAQEQGGVYVDYYAAMSNPDGAMKPELAGDGVVHPNAAGYAVMEPLVEVGIKKALAGIRP